MIAINLTAKGLMSSVHSAFEWRWTHAVRSVVSGGCRARETDPVRLPACFGNGAIGNVHRCASSGRFLGG